MIPAVLATAIPVTVARVMIMVFTPIIWSWERRSTVTRAVRARSN